MRAIIADVKNGIINGKANQTYYGEFDFEGELTRDYPRFKCLFVEFALDLFFLFDLTSNNQ